MRASTLLVPVPLLCLASLPALKTGTDDETPEFRSNAKVVDPTPGTLPKAPDGFVLHRRPRGSPAERQADRSRTVRVVAHQRFT